jgi:hypothetical protein
VKVHWTDVAVAAVIVATGCVATYAGVSRAIRRAVAERQLKTDRELDGLTATVKALQLRVAELGGEQGGTDAAAGAAENTADEESGLVKPETLAVMTAAATAFLGKKAQVHAVRAMPAPDAAGAWAQQGRVIVQTSHNLRRRA